MAPGARQPREEDSHLPRLSVGDDDPDFKRPVVRHRQGEDFSLSAT